MLEELKKEVKKLYSLEEKLTDDFEIDYPTKLSLEVQKQYEKIFNKVLEICKKEKIKDYEVFDKKYNIFEEGLEDFIENIKEFFIIYSGDSKDDAKKELDVFQKILNQFNINKKEKQDLKLYILNDTRYIGDENKAEELLQDFIKKYPKNEEGYNTKCNWELEKKKPDMEKVVDIIMESKENEALVDDEDIYESVINYYKKKGDKKKEKQFKQMLQDIKEKQYFDEDMFDESDIFEDDFSYDDEIDGEELDDLIIEEIREVADDKVSKNKTFEDYIKGMSDIKKFNFLGPQAVFMKENERNQVINNVSEYISKNYKTILKENLKYMPKDLIEFLKTVPDSGIKEIGLKNKFPSDIDEIMKKYTLNIFLIAFWQLKGMKLLIAVPLISNIKNDLKDKDVKKENKKFNEILNLVNGIINLYGAVKAKEIYNLVLKIYEKDGINQETDIEYFSKLLFIICNLLNIASIKFNEKGIEYIYNNSLDEKTAKSIMKKQSEIKVLPKEEYLKYSKENFWKDFNGYKKLKRELNSRMFGEQLIPIIDGVLAMYVPEKQIGSKRSDEIINKLFEEMKKANKELGIPFVNENKLKAYFKEIDLEIPRWK